MPRVARTDTLLTAVAVLAAGLVAAWIAARAAVDERGVIAAVAGVLCVTYFALGRRDLTRPHVALPVVWFFAVAVSQLKILDYETRWSADTTIAVFAGPLLFSATSGLVGGHASRPKERLALKGINPARLRVCAVALLGLGAVGMLWKVRILGSLPLLAEEIDAARSAGGIKVPAYVTFLTDCLLLSAWASMLSFALRTRGSARLIDVLGILAALVGVSFNASRNTLLIALLVPLIFAYLIGVTRAIKGGRAVVLVVLLALVMTIASGLFYLRTSQHQTSRFESYFYSSVVQNTSPPLRPLLPIYVGLATPLETLNRVVSHSGLNSMLDYGTFSFPGIPPQVTPLGPRGDFYRVTAGLSAPYYFNVATYEGSLYADGGLPLVLAISILLGLVLGVARKWLMASPSPARIAIAAYLTYITVFLLYENLLTFYTLAVIWDIGVIAAVLTLCSQRLPFRT